MATEPFDVATEDRGVRLDLALTYSHGHGWLAPFLAAAKRGEALGTRCPHCDRTWCPPRPLCETHRCETEWVALSGRGTLIQVTAFEGRLPFVDERERIALALVQLDGAVNRLLGRFAPGAGELIPGARVRLITPPHVVAHPAQAIWLVGEAALG